MFMVKRETIYTYTCAFCLNRTSSSKHLQCSGCGKNLCGSCSSHTLCPNCYGKLNYEEQETLDKSAKIYTAVMGFFAMIFIIAVVAFIYLLVVDGEFEYYLYVVPIGLVGLGIGALLDNIQDFVYMLKTRKALKRSKSSEYKPSSTEKGLDNFLESQNAYASVNQQSVDDDFTECPGCKSRIKYYAPKCMSCGLEIDWD
jgi:hypothetical protein